MVWRPSVTRAASSRGFGRPRPAGPRCPSSSPACSAPSGGSFGALLANLGTAFFLQAPVVLAEHLLEDEADVGRLALLFRFVQFGAMLPAALGHAALPTLSREARAGSGFGRRYLEMTWMATIAGGTAVALAGLVFGPGLLGVVFGPEYRGVGEGLGFALLLLVTYGVSFVGSQALLAEGRFRLAAAFAVSSALLFLAMAPFAVARLGPLGIVLPAGIGSGLWAVLLALRASRRLGLDLVRSCLVPGAAAVVAFGLALALGAP